MIGALPDARLAILEGYNGIGKTLAVRILELCTGSMPYAPDSPSWESLREGLGHLEVQIEGLQGAERVTWTADSANWQAGSGPIPRDDWFTSISIDGKSASLDEIRRLVRVTRLAGDEDLTQTFAAEAEARAADVHRWAAKHAHSEWGPLKQLEDLAGNAGDLLSSVSIADLARLESEADEAKRHLAEARSEVRALQNRRNLINEALDLRRRVHEMLANEPVLQQELEEIDRQIVERQLELDAAQEEVTQLAAQAGRSRELERELFNAERTRRRNIDKLADAWRIAASRAAALDVESDSRIVREVLNELTERERWLEDQHHQQNQAPAMMVLLESLSSDLNDAEARGLGNQTAIDDADSGLQLSVSKTRVGMAARHQYLQQQPPPPGAVEIAQELEQVSTRKTQAELLRASLLDVGRFQRLVRHNESRVRKALQQGAGGEAAEALERASVRRSECNQVLLELAARRAAVAQRLGTAGSDMSQEELLTRFDRTLASLEISEEQIESELHDIDSRYTEAQSELGELDGWDRNCRQRLLQERTTIRNAFELLQRDANLSWIRSAIDNQSSRNSDDLEDIHLELNSAQRLIRDVLERLGKHRRQLEAIEAALQGVARQLRGQPINATEYVEQLQHWLAASFSGRLNDPRVRHELFRDADDDEDITVDLATRRVHWSESGSKRSRPLEAFSSGEQAFAYTRARLALLDDPKLPVTNRLVVLDEFGAFIAQHLLSGMLEYLKEWTRERQGVHVLLILPLSNDYSQMSRDSIGERAKRYESLAKRVDDDGYATRTIV
ncbi:hypothetical protein [Candidatus Poriferisodalis sp.]|uniref:hypothetical protein n=1 Tax=Candidatus Poriferisodalis sp. TaxID=3101277 RepID=UPI003B0195B0